MNNTAIIILAAGCSARLKQPKQLLRHHQTTFIEHVVGEALAAALQPVIVVTGYDAEKISTALSSSQIDAVYNENWREGMGTSIRAGIEKLLRMQQPVENVIISVCDQPFISGAIFQQMKDAALNSAKGIIACQYEGITGTPALFNKHYFSALLKLSAGQGAKTIIAANIADVYTISFPGGILDIDTMQDYERFLNTAGK